MEGIKRMVGGGVVPIGHFSGGRVIPLEGYDRTLSQEKESRSLPLALMTIDGVGTKALVAAEVGRWEDIGRDLVHHSINDLAVCGAEPFMFVDYIAMGDLREEAVLGMVRGMFQACQRWGVELVGGETAEMPDVYLAGALDLVGCMMGLVKPDELIRGEGVEEGDWLIGLPSSGLHTNGFSLARKIVAAQGLKWDDRVEELNTTIGEALLTEHRCYLEEIRILKRNFKVKALSHITGGGLVGNTKRVIPERLELEIYWDQWEVPVIFSLLQKWGKVSTEEMRRTFNMGVGLVCIVSPQDGENILGLNIPHLLKPFLAGRVVRRS